MFVTATELESKIWPIVIIGTGMGGSTIGRYLAESGIKVLFLDAGFLGWDGEQQGLNDTLGDAAARQVRGYWPTKISGTENGKKKRQFFAPVGSGAGGSSVFYGAALERFERHDLEHSESYPHPVGGWPVEYDTFLPYYRKAEELFQVRGTADPLNPTDNEQLLPAPCLSTADRSLMDQMQENGLNPYRLHVGFQYRNGCLECVGHKCPHACKADARNKGLQPALQSGNALFAEGCRVMRLHGTLNQIKRIEVVRNGLTLMVEAGLVILAAGAYSSPGILLASQNDVWPNGCANSSDMVGRNLMFHVSDLVAVFPKGKHENVGPSKTLAFRDFYNVDGWRLGSFQSMGRVAGYGNILMFLYSLYDKSPLSRFKALRGLLRIPATIAAKMFGEAKVFATIIEDFPEPENRVLYDPENPEIIIYSYTITADLNARRKLLLEKIVKAMRPLRCMQITRELALNYGHPCGTLRFGTDPDSSVLRPDCQSHDIENLYAVDSSFMPTSAGANPSLTIAANALRVGEIIRARMVGADA